MYVLIFVVSVMVLFIFVVVFINKMKNLVSGNKVKDIEIKAIQDIEEEIFVQQAKELVNNEWPQSEEPGLNSRVSTFNVSNEEFPCHYVLIEKYNENLERKVIGHVVVRKGGEKGIIIKGEEEEENKELLLKDIKILQPYFRMKKIGMPLKVIKQKAILEGNENYLKILDEDPNSVFDESKYDIDFTKEEHRKEVVVAGLVIDKSFRRLGFGKKLLEAAVNHAKQNNCTHCIGYCNSKLVQFYCHIGAAVKKFKNIIRKDIKFKVKLNSYTIEYPL
eukprot:TRINITY_DN253_c0_g1_i1.p1 TRINITY_DN253_c0_g1~~TRINITY_DN253_c0_g1_i1.p1  ORF type:complete len:276 (+),score=79.92 TRINITY_DN253_c0_g1_i1:82-909(+)